MFKIHKKFLLVNVILFVVLSGCVEQNQKGDSPEFHKGTDGVVFRFLENSPPSEGYSGDSIPFTVEIKNLGSSQTTPYFWLTGHDTNIIQLVWNGVVANPPTLVGRDENNPSGGYSILEAQSVTLNLPSEVDNYPTNVRLTTCYSYSTFASLSICVDPDPVNDKDDACSAKEVSISGGQGGPVAITYFSESVSREKIRFTLTISNEGKGDVVDQNKIKSCINLMENEKDLIYVSAQPISSQEISCIPNPVRLVNGVGIGYCEMANSGFSNTAFSTILRVKLDYGYKDLIQHTINVRRI